MVLILVKTNVFIFSQKKQTAKANGKSPH